jgi:hypothetical protein
VRRMQRRITINYDRYAKLWRKKYPSKNVTVVYDVEDVVVLLNDHGIKVPPNVELKADSSYPYCYLTLLFAEETGETIAFVNSVAKLFSD